MFKYVKLLSNWDLAQIRLWGLWAGGGALFRPRLRTSTSMRSFVVFHSSGRHYLYWCAVPWLNRTDVSDIEWQDMA